MFWETTYEEKETDEEETKEEGRDFFLIHETDAKPSDNFTQAADLVDERCTLLKLETQFSFAQSSNVISYETIRATDFKSHFLGQTGCIYSATVSLSISKLEFHSVFSS